MSSLFLTKNGSPEATVCLFRETALQIKQAAQELVDGVRLISGAELPVLDSPKKIVETDVAIILSTFGENLTLRSLFPEDYDYLLDSDGFAVRRKGNQIYIFSHQAEGVYYGVHSFLEENAEIIWTRGKRGEEQLYRERKSIKIKKCDYREKSPFKLRGWHACGKGEQGLFLDTATMKMFGKNKNNCRFYAYSSEYLKYGIKPYGIFLYGANYIDELIDEHPEYFMTTAEGKPLKSKETGFASHVNYYNRGAAEAMAEKIIDTIAKNPEYAKEIVHLLIPDDPYFYVIENGVCLSDEPFTTDDGNTVYPKDKNYKSTVFFNYVNRVAAHVVKKYPDCRIMPLAYMYGEAAPSTKISDYVTVGIAPILTNDKEPYIGDKSGANVAIAENIQKWSTICDNLSVYNYWMSFRGHLYSRPIAKVVQKNLLWYESLGITGLIPEGQLDLANANGGTHTFYDLNEMYIWILNRLMWNPHLSIKELERKFCKLAYGKAAKAMQKYYLSIQKGWDDGTSYVFWSTGGDVYIKNFILLAGQKDNVLKSLEKAEKLATTPSEKFRITAIRSVMQTQIEKYAALKDEKSIASYSDKGLDKIFDEATKDFESDPSNVWNTAQKMEILKSYVTLEDFPAEAKFNARMLWDKEYLYIGFCVHDDLLAPFEGSNVFEEGRPLMRTDGTQVESYTETYIGGNMLNMTEYYGYFSGIFLKRSAEFYKNHGSPTRIDRPENYKEIFVAHYNEDPTKRYYFHVQAISLKDLGVMWQDAKPYGSFVYYTDRYGRAGWKGNGLWCKDSFSEFVLKDKQTIE